MRVAREPQPTKWILVLGCLSFSLGCASSPREEKPAPTSASAQEETPEVKTRSGAKAVAEGPAASGPSETSPLPQTSEQVGANSSPDSKEVPKALKDLQAKIQPGGPAGPTAVRPDDDALKSEADAFVEKWLDALRTGSVAEAEKFTFSSELFQTAVTSGYREILQGNILSQNRVVMERLASLMKGKKVQHEWKPGGLSWMPARHIFVKSAPSLTNGTVQVDVDGVAVEIRLDQLVYIDKEWKIFRLSIP